MSDEPEKVFGELPLNLQEIDEVLNLGAYIADDANFLPEDYLNDDPMFDTLLPCSSGFNPRPTATTTINTTITKEDLDEYFLAVQAESRLNTQNEPCDKQPTGSRSIQAKRTNNEQPETNDHDYERKREGQNSDTASEHGSFSSFEDSGVPTFPFFSTRRREFHAPNRHLAVHIISSHWETLRSIFGYHVLPFHSSNINVTCMMSEKYYDGDEIHDPEEIRAEIDALPIRGLVFDLDCHAVQREQPTETLGVGSEYYYHFIIYRMCDRLFISVGKGTIPQAARGYSLSVLKFTLLTDHEIRREALILATNALLYEDTRTAKHVSMKSWRSLYLALKKSKAYCSIFTTEGGGVLKFAAQNQRAKFSYKGKLRKRKEIEPNLDPPTPRKCRQPSKITRLTKVLPNTDSENANRDTDTTTAE